MATSDIRIGTIQRPLGRTMVPSTYIEASTKAGGTTRPPYLLAVLRKRWYLLLFILPLMGAAGYGAAIYYGKNSTKVSSTLLYTGLPMPTGQQVYQPLDITSTNVLITSPENLNRVMKLHGLSIPPAIFERFLEIKTSRAGVLELTFTWADSKECIAILNDINESFIQQVANQRRQTMQQYVPEIERSLLATKSKVTEISNRLQTAKDELATNPDERMLNGNSDIILLDNALDQAESAKLSTEAELAGLGDAKNTIIDTAKSQLLEISNKAFDNSLLRYAENHPDRKKILEAKKQINSMIQSSEEIATISELLDEVYQINKRWVAAEDLQQFTKLLNHDAKMLGLAERRNSLELTLLTKTREIERIKLRKTAKLKEIAKDKNQLDEQAIAARKTADRIDQLKAELEEANSSRLSLQNQLESLRQLENTQVHEYTVITPPSMETAITTSDKKKLFVGGFFLAGLLLIPPVLVVEWMARRETPLEEASRVFSLAVLGRNITGDSLGETSSYSNEQDSVRMLALRIQQSLCGAESATVLFSSLDRSPPAANLVAEIGKCLAEREERILILDASGSPTCHEHLIKSLNQSRRTLLLTSANQQNENFSTTPITETRYGLAEYLTQENLGLRDLLQSTADSRIDYFSGGDQPLPREGFATRRLTNLFLECRKEYSTILVIGPDAYHNADLQMLAARADGIIFTVGKQSQRNKAGYEALHELLELEAPVLGVVG